MFGNIFANMPPVVKNLLIINGLFFLASLVFANQLVNGLPGVLGLHYIDSPGFEPFQLATHFFMHGGIAHIFFNMFALVVFGSHLERFWGAKRFLIFYFVTALGAAVLHMLVQGIELYQLTGSWFPYSEGIIDFQGEMILYPSSLSSADAISAGRLLLTPTVGASGAVYGLIMAFAMLFPNTQFMLLFPPIPIKAKWLAVGLGAIALFSGFQNNPGDSVAHFAHLGGMLFGFIMIKIWQRNRSDFY